MRPKHRDGGSLTSQGEQEPIPAYEEPPIGLFLPFAINEGNLLAVRSNKPVPHTNAY